MIPLALAARNDGQQAGGLRFFRSTAHRAYDHKNLVRIPDFKDRLAGCGKNHGAEAICQVAMQSSL
jgi:hypothetical protein